MTEKEALVALSAFVPFGPVRIKLLREYFGSYRKVWGATPDKLGELGLGQNLVGEFLEFRESFDFYSYFAQVSKFGLKVITPDDKSYPKLLKEIDNSPIIIYVKGELKPADEVAIAIVGSRRVTSYGKEIASKISSELASSGVTIVSGLALGVDAVAHEAALDVGGRTLAVLGNGLDSVYPSTHRALAQNIVKNGALISEYPLGYPALPHNFPQRNRIVSGLSLGVVVIEGTEKSGTLLTASHAAQQGREVFAVPGPVTSPNSGAPHILLRQGAKLVTSARDILEELDLEHRTKNIEHREILPESKEEMEILKLLELEGLDIDSIVRISGIETPVVLATLTSMELKGIVRNSGGVYSKLI